MKIIIIGNGKVGFTLARQLSGENHELVLIDQRAEEVRRVLEANGFAIAETGQSEGWFSFVCQ